MNAYNSIVRRVVSKGVYSAAISPATDFTVAAAGFSGCILPIDLMTLNVQSSIRVNNIGIYCNFADGLVWKTPGERIIAEVIAHAYSLSAPNPFVTNTMDFKQNSKVGTLTAGVIAAYAPTVIFTTEYQTVPTPALWHKQLHTVISNNGAAAVTLSDYPLHSVSVVAGKIVGLTQTTLLKKQAVEINNLNDMVPLDLFLSPSLYAVAATVAIGIGVSFHNGEGTTFLTKSIDTAFSGNYCTFDCAADIEYTPA